MALQGTLKDFGIADILQLIGQQQKTGTLEVKSKDQEVFVGFRDGNIVKAESSTRKRKDLLGNMLVRAEIISEQQLQDALEDQKRTLKRLGDVLITTGVVTAERFREMMGLQTTETLYRLFTWKSGTYEFEQGEVEYDEANVTPLRAESVLMEGFRMVDEWPLIKKKVSRYDLTFERVKGLPLAPVVEKKKPVEDDFDDAFSEAPRAERKGDFASLGEGERRIYGLVGPGKDVRKIIDLACLGEFETCKALTNLVNLDYLKIIYPNESSRDEAMLEGAGLWERARGIVGRVAVTAVGLGILAFLIGHANLESISMAGGNQGPFVEPAAQKLVSRSQLSRIQAALDVYQLEKGELPGELGALVTAGLLRTDDLSYPWKDGYYYRRVAPQEFILLPPLR